VEQVKSPAVTPAAGGVFRSLLPERAVEDVLAGVLRMNFGGSSFTVPVLVIAKADDWRARLNEEFVGVMGALEGQTNAAGVLAFLGSHTPKMIGLIREYDVEGTLPDDEWLRGHATEPEILRAFMLLLAASFPFIAAALDILAANPDALKLVLEEFGPTSNPKLIPGGSPLTTSPEPTAGPTKRSGRRSPTSNSQAT
jgi:hypothetical protein